MRWVVLAVLLAASLAGCSGGGDGPKAAATEESNGNVPDGKDANGTDDDGNATQPPQNGTPVPRGPESLSANLSANATNGSAPFNVTFYLNVTSGKGQPVNYTLQFGDGNSTNGTIMPGLREGQGNGTAPGGSGDAGGNSTGNGTAGGGQGGGNGSFGGQGGTHTFQTVSVNYTYNWTGPYNVSLNVTQGNDTANATLNVTVEPQEEQVFEDSVLCAPTVVLNGSFGGNEHEFDVSPGQRNLTLTLAYDDSAVADLDMTITDPAGTETASEEPGPEPPVSFQRPMVGTWKVEVVGFSCAGTQDYTLTAAFA